MEFCSGMKTHVVADGGGGLGGRHLDLDNVQRVVGLKARIHVQREHGCVVHANLGKHTRLQVRGLLVQLYGARQKRAQEHFAPLPARGDGQEYIDRSFRKQVGMVRAHQMPLPDDHVGVICKQKYVFRREAVIGLRRMEYMHRA